MNKRRISLYLLTIISGLMFGFMPGLISFALVDLAREFMLSQIEQGVLAAAHSIGALIAPIAVLLTHTKRNKLILLGGPLILGGILAGVAPNVLFEFLARVVIGVTGGAITTLVVPYVKSVETDEGQKRRLLTVYNGVSSAGLALGSLVGLLGMNWRLLLAVPPIILGGGAVVLARWFLPSVEVATTSIPRGGGRGTLSTLLRSRSLWVGLILGITYYASGINALTYFIVPIFVGARIQNPVAASLIVNILGGAGTFVGGVLLEKTTPRKLMICGALWMLPSMGIMSWAYATTRANALALVVGMVSYNLAFSSTWQAAYSRLASALFSDETREQGYACVQFSAQLTNIVIAGTFLQQISLLGTSGTLGCYTILMLIAAFFLWKFVPEVGN